MALFGSRKKVEDTSAQGAPVAAQKSATQNTAQKSGPVAVGNFAHVLKNPRITEKASMHQSTGTYTFDVDVRATKTQIASAIKSVYKVSPRKIRIVQIPAKRTRNMRTGHSGVKTGGKKAYVYLKNGETITIA